MSNWYTVHTDHEIMIFYKGVLVYKKWTNPDRTQSMLSDMYGPPRRWSSPK